MQRDVFIRSEADAWDARNVCVGASETIAKAIADLGVSPKSCLEIGCGRGKGLRELQLKFGSEISGIDPSGNAIAFANSTLTGDFRVGTANNLPFENEEFDLVIFGFCFYLIDPQDYFTVIANADRVLSNKGFLVVYDFLSNVPRKNRYSHVDGVYSHKMEFSRLFTAHPSYRMVSRVYSEHSVNFSFDRDQSVSVDVLRKDIDSSFQLVSSP